MDLLSAILEFIFMGPSAQYNVFEKLVAAVLKVARQEMKDIYEEVAQVVADVWGFAKGHPMFCTAVALGILSFWMPWSITVLGSVKIGHIEGTFTASWKSINGSSVPPRSFFSFFHRLGSE